MNAAFSDPAIEALAFQARPVGADPALAAAYFAKVEAYEADRLRAATRAARLGWTVGALGLALAALGVGAVAALAPLKSVEPLVFRVDAATGAVERVYDVEGGAMAASEAVTRYFLWAYVRARESYSYEEAQAAFDAAALMSTPEVQAGLAEAARGSNPKSPQARLGRTGRASVRWVSTSFLNPALAQVRFVRTETQAGLKPVETPLIATIGFAFAPQDLGREALAVNPLGLLVTSWRVDEEAPR